MTLLVMLATTSVQAEQVDETVLTVVTEVPTVDGGQTSNWGTNGSENYDKLVDGDLNTKYGLSNEDPYVEFHYEKAIVPKGYGLWTANDQSYRTPPAWTIKAKLNASDEWTTLVDRFYNRNYDKLPMTNNISATFTLDNTKSYKYFRFEAERCSSVSGKNFQLAELRFYVEREAGVLYESQVTILKAINSTGAQAFNTGYTHKANTRIEMDCEVTKNTQRDWEALFGARLHDFYSNAFCFFSRHHKNSTAVNGPCFNRSGVETVGYDFVYDQRIKLVCENKTATWYKYSSPNTVAGSVTTTGTADDGKTPMFLFNLNTADTAGGTTADTSPSVMTLYSCKIYEGSTLMRDYVPAKYNNVVGLYDRVNKTFSGSITSTAFLAVNDPAPNNQADYERALAAIEDGKGYRIYTMYNGQKYYVTANGRLSTAVADAPLFEFKKVAPNTSTDGAGEYGYGFQIKLQKGSNTYYFSNADDENGGKLKAGYLNARTDEHRTTWEAQVFFLNAEGKYAIRSTNAKSGTTGWAKIGSAFWTVETGTNGPVAQYDYEMNYVWQLEVEDDVQTNYERALATIVDGQKYRVYTMYNGQKYYVTANGKLSTAVTDAPLFEFKKVTANASEREYQYGFQLKNGSYYFTNPKEQSEEYLTKGQLNTTNGNSRTTWEAQVFFLNTEGKYAIRSTNSKYSNDHTNWGWIGSAFWTVNTGPLAEYSWDMNYVWELEDAGPGEPEVYTGFATIDGIYCNLDGTTRKAEVTYKDEYYNSYSGDVTVPEKVTYLGTDYTVTAIGEEAFFRSSDLTSVTLPATVTTIDAGAFQYCTALTSFTVSKSVTSIGENPFSGCNGLTSLTVESGNPKYDSRDNCNAIIDSEVNTLVSACNVTVIPDDVKTIGTCSFLGLNKITSVEIPNSVESIASYAFYSCTNLASVTFSENLKTIDNDAFQSCTALMEIHSLVETPFTTGSHVFFKNTYKNATLYVPIGTKSAYESTEVWSNFENIVEETNTVTYPVWVGDTQVTDANKGDVLGDGTVTYEPGEGTGTLTFSSGTTTINGMYNAAKIYADGINLTIDAPKGLFIENNVYGIYMSGANSELTVNGDLTFKTSQNPIYNSSRININGNLTAAEGYTGINASYIAVNGNVNMKLSTYCISASEIVLNGTKHELSASSPCLSGTNITVTGDLTATSNNTPAINAKGDVTLVSGTWTLDGGNTRAIEWGSNANLNIPSTYAIIEPENAQIQTASSGYNARKTIADAEGNEATHVVIGDPSALVTYTVNITGGRTFAQEPDPYVPMEAPVTEFKAGSTVYILPNAVYGEYVTGWNTSPDIDITQKELVYYFKMPAENVTLTPVYSSQTPLTYDLSDGKQVRIGDDEDDLLALDGLLMLYWQKGQLLGTDEFDYYDLDGDGTNDITLYMDQDSEELVIQATDGTNLTGIYYTENNISPFGPIKIKFSQPVITLDEEESESGNRNILDYWEGQDVSFVLKRTLKVGGWNTFTSPVTFSDFTGVFGEGVKVKQLKDATLTDGVLNLKFEDATTIEAFTPYLVKVAADVDLSQKTITGNLPYIEPVIVETAALKFIPTMGLPQNSHTDDPKSVLFIGAGSKLYYADALPLDIKGFRAYFVLDDPAAVRSISMDFGDDGGATLMNSVGVNSEQLADEWYSVDGRKLSGRPTAKGVYINNGKKTIVK